MAHALSQPAAPTPPKHSLLDDPTVCQVRVDLAAWDAEAPEYRQ